jgi:hypothetical protein
MKKRKRIKIEKRSGWGIDIVGDIKTGYEAEKYGLETCWITWEVMYDRSYTL